MKKEEKNTKISNGYSGSSMSYSQKYLWNYINQPTASKVAINTYADSASVKSDLMNSYAWDTAIVFIQECGYTNYANQSSKNSSLSNTGANNDEVCKINDMASNLAEWTTEYASSTSISYANPCTSRGGDYYDNSNDCTASRYNLYYAAYSSINFRSTSQHLYVGLKIDRKANKHKQ